MIHDSSKETLLLLYALKFSSLFVVVSDPLDTKVTLQKFKFVRGLLDSFDGNVTKMNESYESFPNLLILFFAENNIKKSSSELISSFLSIENGFNNDIAMRNQLREMLNEVFITKEAISIPLAEADQFITNPYALVSHTDISNM